MIVTDLPTSILPEPMRRISRDIAKSASLVTDAEARFLVDSYYQVQEYRIAAAAQARTLAQGDEPNHFVTWTTDTMEYIESQIKRGLDKYTDGHPVGQWSKSVVGIGPVLAAGVLAHITIDRAPTVGHIWRFAGLDPTVTWNKGQKRPWNASLKVITWKIGESFVKVQSNPNDVYGRVYAKRKELEVLRNAEGLFSEQAAQVLGQKRIGKDTDAYTWYSQGMLPPAHIHARAKRYAVKLYLAHWHEVAFFVRNGVMPPVPYMFTEQAREMGLGDHHDYIGAPHAEVIDGLREAQEERRIVLLRE